MSKKDHHKESIHKAVQRGNLEAVAAFLKKKPYLVNAEDESGHTPIHLAALHGYYDIAELLAQNGADLNKQDASGWTALHFAASGRNEKLLKLFLDQPTVDVTIKNEGQNIPLHYVAKTYPDISAAIIKTLLERGSNINAQNAQGETPLHGAALKGYDQMAEKLIEFGADPDISNNEGETPLNWATRNNHTKVISVLLKAYSNKGRNKPKLNLKDGRSKREDEVNVVTPKTPSNVQVPKRTSLVSDPLTERYELTFFGDNFLLSLNDDNWDKCLYEGGISLERLKNPNLTPEQSPVPHPDSLKKEELPLSKLFHLYLTISGTNKTDPDILHWIVKFLTGPKKEYLLYLLTHYVYRIRVRSPLRENALTRTLSTFSNANVHSSSNNSTSVSTQTTEMPMLLLPSLPSQSTNLTGTTSNVPSAPLTSVPSSEENKGEDHRDGDSPTAANKLKEQRQKRRWDIWREPTEKDKELFSIYFELDTERPALLRRIEMEREQQRQSAQSPRNVPPSSEGRDRSFSLLQHRQLSKFHWEIDPREIQIIDKIGKGSFGVVYKGIWMGVEVAIKKVDADDMTKEAYQNFLYELSMMSNLRHPHILAFLGGCLEPPNLCFVTEFVSRGSLYNVLKNNEKELTWPIRLQMALEAAKGLLYLHHQKPPIVHRDLKSLNLLVDEHFHIRVADFGLSKDKNNDINTKMGTLNWVAPEILSDNSMPYTEKADIYSFGLVLWEIVTGKTPYEGKTTLQIVRMIDMGERPQIPDTVDPDYAQIIRDCWASDPFKRPTIDEVHERLLKVKEKYAANGTRSTEVAVRISTTN